MAVAVWIGLCSWGRVFVAVKGSLQYPCSGWVCMVLCTWACLTGSAATWPLVATRAPIVLCGLHGQDSSPLLLCGVERVDDQLIPLQMPLTGHC
jgi:hypothetical protein